MSAFFNRQDVLEHMQLYGYSERTQEAYLRELSKLSEHYHRRLDELTESQVRGYILFLRTQTRLGSASIKMALHAIRFYLRSVLGHANADLPYIRIRREVRLPDVLTIGEVRAVVEREPAIHHRTFFWTVYSLGLRLSEAVNLQPMDIDSGRRLVHVHRGKGARDRYVPLPARTLQMLREYWRTHRNPQFLFPGAPHKSAVAARSPLPIARGTVQGALRLAVRRIGLSKRISVHTLRHSYATHLLEGGVSLTLIQRYLGHTSPSATMLYMHLTTRGQESALETIESLMR